MRLKISALLAATALAMTIQAQAAAPPVRMEIVTAPKAGAQATAKKGEEVVSTSAMEAVDAITTKNGYIAGGLVLPPGRMSMWRTYGGGKLYQFHGSLRLDTEGGTRLVTGGVFVPNGGKPPQLFWNGLTKPVFIEAPGVVFTETPYRKNSLTTVKSDLLYTGLADGKPGFLYREFDGDLVRPVKTEPVPFDGAPGGELQTHGGRIRIVSVAEEEVRYVVAKPMDAPAFVHEAPPPPPPEDEDELFPPNDNGRRPMTPPAPDLKTTIAY